MKITNHFRAIFAIAMMLCVAFPSLAHDFEVGGIYYNITSSTAKTVAVTYKGNKYNSYSNEYTGYFTIPSSVTYNGTTYSVTSIGSYAFYNCYGLTSVTIPNSVTTIDNYTFSGCSGLTSVTIPNSVTEIGDCAFRDCSGLTSVTIGNSVTSIGSSAFSGCSGLTSVTIPNSVTSIGSSAFYNCTSLTSVTIPNSVTSIGSYAFYNCYGLPSITIPNSVTSIGNGAFSGCSGLTSVTIPNFVTSIGEYTFYGCSGLTSVTIPNSVTSIGSSAFYGCSGLTSVTIPNSVTKIGYKAFYGCSGLTSVTIPNSVTSIGDYAFRDCTGLTEVNYNAENCTSMGSSSCPVFSGCSNLKTLNIGNEVETIPNYAFRYCDGLTSVTIPNSVTSIGDWAFNNCTGLTEVNYNAENCTSMGSSSYPVFSGCSSLKTLNIGNEVETIPNYAFRYCDGLTSVTIPNSVTSIGDGAFEDCTGLTEVTIGNSVTSIGDYAFGYCSNLKLVINLSNLTFSKGSSDYGKIAYYANRVINAPNGSIVGDFVFSKATNINSLVEYLGNATKLILPTDFNGENYIIGDYAFRDCTGLTSVTIPNLVTSIGVSAFSGCTGLTSVTIGNSVTEIGNNAFYGCPGLTSVTIGNSVTSIGKSAFNGCTGLTSVTIPNSVTSIGNYAFHGCSGLTSVTIGNSVTSIGSDAFSSCTGLTKVTIPNSVTKIDGYAFFGCTLLTEIIIPNSVTTIGRWAFSGTAWYSNLAGGIIYINNVLYVNKGTMQKGTSISIKEGTISISPRAFYDCSGLTSVTIPNSVTSIGYEAFCGCTNLKEIVSLSENPPACENNSFDSENYTNSTLYVPKDSYAKYFINDVWGQFNNIVKLENLVSNISINSSSISLELGKTTTLSATVLPSSATFPNLYWESNNENVATVDQTGKVTAHSKGEAIITAKSMDGSNITASCVVKVFTYDVESITLSQHDATLAIKDKVTLKYTITPSYVTDNSVTWSNSNPSVASMAKNSDGSVTISCQEEGETIIKVTTNDGTNLSDSCKITVYRIPPTITLSKTSENLLIHNTVKLKYTITNSTINTATWSTSDATVASITSNTDGSVTVFAEAEGVATITATMIDVNGKEFSATCEITVIPPTIVLSQTVANLPVNELLTLNYDITNSSIKNATWTTSNPDVAPIKVNSDGSVIVVGLSKGEAIITATMTEVNGVEYSASCEVTVGISGVEGIETDNKAIEISRYDIHGCRLSKPSRGVNIVIYSDGSIRKEIIKE